MPRMDKKEWRWIRRFSVLVLFFFSVNTLAWAYPPSPRYSDPRSPELLQVQSMFDPLVDAAGKLYGTQIRLELSCMLSMALKDTPVPFQDINAEIDKWLCASGKKESERFLSVITDPVRADNGVELYIEIMRGRSAGRRFRFLCPSRLLQDPVSAGPSLIIEEIPSEVSPEDMSRMGNWAFPAIRVDPAAIEAVDRRGEVLGEINTRKSMVFTLKGLEKDLLSRVDPGSGHTGLMRALISQLIEGAPETFVYDQLYNDLFGFSAHFRVPRSSLAPGSTLNLIALHTSVSRHPAARFHEVVEYLVRAGRAGLELKGEVLHIRTGNDRYKVDIGQAMDRMARDDESWARSVKWTLRDDRKTHYLVRLLGRAVLGDRLDRSLTETIRVEQVAEQLSNTASRFDTGWKNRLSDFYRRYADLVARKRIDTGIISSSRVQYRRMCMSSRRIADLFYLRERYGFDLFRLLESGRTSFAVQDREGGAVELTIERSIDDGYLLLYGNAGNGITATVGTATEPEDDPSAIRGAGKAVEAHFLINVQELLSWAESPGFMKAADLSADETGELAGYYSDTGFQLIEDELGRVYAAKTLLGGLDAFLLLPRELLRVKGMPLSVLLLWSQREVDTYLSLVSEYMLPELTRANGRFARFMAETDEDRYYTPAAVAEFIVKDIEKRRGGALRDLGDGGSETIGGSLLEHLEKRSRTRDNPARSLRIKNEAVYAVLIEDTPEHPLPEGMYATHFVNSSNDIVIVLKRELPKAVALEAVYHEWREYLWEDRLYTESLKVDDPRVKAHRLAAAEEVLLFGTAGLTPFHRMQLLEKWSGDTEKLAGLLMEDRKGHYELVKRFLGTEAVAKINWYERELRKRLVRMVEALDAGKRPEDTGSKPLLTLPPDVKRKARDLISKMKKGQRYPSEVARKLLGSNRPEAVTMYLVSRLQNANKARDSRLAEALTAALLEVLTKERAGRKLLAKLFHSDIPGDAECARYLWTELGDKGIYHLMTAGTFDRHRLVRDRCLQMFASLIENDIRFAGKAIDVYGRVRGMEEEEADFILRAFAAAGFTGSKNVEYYLDSPARAVLAGEVLDKTRSRWGLGNGRIGKKAGVSRLVRDRHGLSVQVVSSVDRNKVLAEKMPLYPDDITSVKDILKDLAAERPGIRELIRYYLALLEKSPPQFYIFDRLYDDLFGFIRSEENILAVHRDLSRDPAALFHELSEYFSATGAMSMEYVRDRIVRVRGEDGRIIDMPISPFVRQRIIAEKEKWGKGWKRSAHYLSRAVQIENMGKDPFPASYDKVLSEKITALQKSAASDEAISGPFLDPSGNTYYARSTEDPSVIDGVLDKWFSGDEHREWGRVKYDAVLENAGYQNKPCSLVYLRGLSGEILGVALSKRAVLPFSGGNKETWLLELAEVAGKYRAEGLGSVMLAKVAETVIEDHCREHSVEIYDGEWDVIWPEWLEKHILCVHPEEDSGYAETLKNGRQALDFFMKNGFSGIPVIWMASPDEDEADKDIWMAIPENKALSLMERVREQMRSVVADVPRQRMLFEDPSFVPERSSSSGSRDEHEDMRDARVKSFLAGIFENRLWKAFTAVSTVFHELGHLEWAYHDGQNPEYRLGDVFNGNLDGISGKPARFGGILGNAAGALLGLLLYYVSLGPVSALALAEGGFFVNVLGVYFMAFIAAYPLSMNLGSMVAELIAFIAGQGDLAEEARGIIPGAISSRGRPKKESGWMFRPLSGMEPMKADDPRDMYVLGDQHAELDGFRRSLEGLGLVRRAQESSGLNDDWTGGIAILLQGGDVIDRGPMPEECVRYLRYLQDRAAEKGGKVIRLLGNHELFYLMRRARGKWKGMVEHFKREGDFRGFDEQLWKDDLALASMLRKDIRDGRIQAAYTYGGKVFSHGFIDDKLIIRLNDETGRPVWRPEVFCETANDILTASVKRDNYDSILFSFAMGVVDDEVDGLFSKYFTDTVLAASGYDPNSGRLVTAGRRARLAVRKLQKGSAYLDKLPFDQVCFHDPFIYMLNGHIPVFRGESSSRSAVCADVGMTAEYGSGRAALVFRKGMPLEAKPPERTAQNTTGRNQGHQKSLEALTDLDAMKEAFSDTTALSRGFSILQNGVVGKRLISPRDVGQLNPRVTGFDIAILPFLERVPLFYGNMSNDWGVYGITGEGIEYRCATSSEFIPFKTGLGDNMSRVLKQSVDIYFSEKIDTLTRHMIIYPWYPLEDRPARKLLVRGKEMIDALPPRDAVKMRRFLGEAKEVEESAGTPDVDRLSLSVLFGMLEELPEIYKYGTPRDKWFWVLREDGIEFVDTEVNARQLVEFTSDPRILKSVEFKRVLAVLQVLSRAAANTLVNELDLAALSAGKGFLTPYDELRKGIETEQGVRLPIAYEHCAVYEAAGRREKVPLDEVITRRFPLRELRYLETVLRVIPDRLHEENDFKCYSYRPSEYRNFTVDLDLGTGNGKGVFGMASGSGQDWENMASVMFSPDIKKIVDTLDERRQKRLTWIKGVLHEIARQIYSARLGEEKRREYSSLSWDLRSWSTMRTGKRKKRSGEDPEEHFLFESNEGGNSSKGDFADHFAAYILFGPQFRKQAEEGGVFTEKYRFLKENILGGMEFGAISRHDQGLSVNDEPGPGRAGNIGKYGAFIELSPDMRKAIALDILRDHRIEFPVENEGPVRPGHLIRAIADDKRVRTEHCDVLKAVLDLIGSEKVGLMSFRAAVNDLFGFRSPEDGCVGLHAYIKDDRIAVLHELAEYLIQSGRLRLLTAGDMINVYATGDKEVHKLGSVQVTRSDALRQLTKGDSPHYVLRALLREIFGEEDAALSAKIKMLKLEREQTGLDRTYELGGDNACGEITRDLGSELIWIKAGKWAYRLLLTEDGVHMTRYDKREGEAVGRDHEFRYDKLYVVGRDPELSRYSNGHSVNDPSLSREHFAFRISREEGDVFTVTARDLGSKNGTLVGLRLREKITGDGYLFMDGYWEGTRTSAAVIHDPKGLLDGGAPVEEDPGPGDRILDIQSFLDRAQSDDNSEETAREVIKDTFRASMPLIREVRQVLNAAGAPEKERVPVDITVDLSLVPAEDLEENMKTWAYLILMCAGMRDVNFCFELPEVPDAASIPEELVADRRGAPTAVDAEAGLKRYLSDLAWLNDQVGDIESFSRNRVNAPSRPDAVEIQLISSGHLEWMREAGEDLDDTQYPVALEGHTRGADNITVLRNFQAALSMGLVEAALAVASIRDRKIQSDEDKELPGLKKKFLPGVRDLYAALRGDVTITGQTLENMVHPEPTVRLNLAISLALPPVTRMLFLKLRQTHENLHMFLMSA
ncbi:MAG: FHA domain-containing protein [Candidatus Omnitrophica bacterium]|nr:FHA domain-containing protein [Candidatus Omnitrophota bacterium]